MRFLGLFCISVLLISCSSKQQDGSKISLVSPEEFSTVIKQKDLMLVDVRTDGEYTAGFIKGAVNIDISADDFDRKMSHFDKNVPIAVYCAKGGRSASAAKKLKNLGFTQIYDLDGGFTAWKKVFP